MFNLHTHTYRCHHASGKDEEYVIKAIQNGYDLMGFSDHAPYLFPNGYVSSFRMLPSEVGNDVIIGLDAHNPSVYDDKENLQKAKQILQNLNITPLDKIEL